MTYRPCQVLFRSATCKLISRNLCTFSGDTINLSYSSYDDIETSGSTVPVMVLHGLLSTRKCWTNVCETIHINTGRKVINVDNRNHGESPHSSQHTYIHLANDTRHLINSLKIPKVTVLGHSMGGRAGMVMSLLYPELVSSLIIVDISPVSISEALKNTFPQILEFLTKINLAQFTNVEDAKSYAKETLMSFGMKETDTTLPIILKNVGIRQDDTVGWTCNMEILNKNFSTITRFPFMVGRSYPGPVLFIAAGQSDFIPPEDMEGIKGFFPQAQVEVVPGVGHNMQDEDDTMLIELATEFLLKNKISIRESKRSSS